MKHGGTEGSQGRSQEGERKGQERERHMDGARVGMGENV